VANEFIHIHQNSKRESHIIKSVVKFAIFFPKTLCPGPDLA